MFTMLRHFLCIDMHCAGVHRGISKLYTPISYNRFISERRSELQLHIEPFITKAPALRHCIGRLNGIIGTTAPQIKRTHGAH